MDQGQGAKATKIDLFAFGSRSGPRHPRQGIDFVADASGMFGPEYPPFPMGASLFADPQQAPLRGHYHRLESATVIPADLSIVADGVDLFPNSVHPATHHTLYPTATMAAQQFIDAFLALPWQYSGRKS